MYLIVSKSINKISIYVLLLLLKSFNFMSLYCTKPNKSNKIKYSKSLLKSFLLIVFLGVFSSVLYAKTGVTKLVCEYHENPVGIDVEHPRLSWQLFSDEQNIVQSAYEIRVASSEKELSSGSKQLWNSGKIESDQSVNVVYGGPTPESMQRVYWQVRVWDNDGKASSWSEPAYWEMGILEPELWKASWITLSNEPESEDSKPAQYYRNEFSTYNKI